MEDQEFMVGVRDFGFVSSSNEKAAQQVSGGKESENLVVDLLEDLDSYWDDVNNRLTISRMVSDSIIKGMVKAVEQAAEEKIASKELQVDSLQEKLHSFRLGADKSESSLGLPLACHEMRSKKKGLCHCFSSKFLEHDNMRESLGNVINEAKGQIKQLKKAIDSIRGCSSTRRISSCSEFAGLGGILQEKVSERLAGVDKMLETLKMTLDEIDTHADNMAHLSKASLCEWKLEAEFHREIEAMVIQSSIHIFREECEEKLRCQNTQLERINEVSNVRKELNAILNSLSNPENGHGSHDMDHFHRRGLSTHVSPSTSLWEGNGVFEESKNGMPENSDAAQLNHMTKEELVNYFNNMITKMMRNRESNVQEMTREFFSLKREYLREIGSSSPLRKDKDVENLRKKIPELILKLNDIIAENETLSTMGNNAETLGCLKNRIDSLVLENRQLRVSLSDQRKQVQCLSLQVSDAAEKMKQHSLAEANLLKLIENLKSDVEDAEIEASAIDEVYKCFLREVSPITKRVTDELEMQSIHVQEISEIGDSDYDFLVMQGLCGVIFKEGIMDAQSKINDLTRRYVDENENRVSLELKALQREEELRLVIEEKKRLEQEVHLLVGSLEEREKVSLELSAALVKEKEQFHLASQKVNNLEDQTSLLQNLVSERSMEVDFIKGELVLVLKQIEVDKGEIKKLDQKVELMTKELREADEHRNMLLAIMEDSQNRILLLEAKEDEQRKQMRSVIVLVHGLSRGLSELECQVAERAKNNNLRLEKSSSELYLLKNTTLLYKKRLQRRCNDLQMAESEVDLLGDEVDALLSLLEKIYIALDHYSPIFQHYPGVMEILKLVKRELSRYSTMST